ncbi:LPXTG cell wall anchor domain-containing protein [Agreia sp.]|uniref:LPXTG cell wall anchor domain-containing protein n=1 Tax=Agreia sp. TaxID=1872416 RepID=UPI0035BC59B3
MSRSILSRLGAGIVATALVAGGSLLVAGPATAAEPNTITLANTAFQSGAGWGAGIQVTGNDFPATTEVTIFAGIDNGSSGETWGETTVTTDEAGAFTTTFVPEAGPYDVAEDETASVVASYEVEGGDGEVPFVLSNVVELQIAAFVPAAQNVTVDPVCLSGDAVRDPGVLVGATGFGQFEEGITYSVTDAAGNVIPGDDDEPLTADETGSFEPQYLQLFSTAGNIPDGSYTITFVGSVTTAGVFAVGPCDVPVVPAAVSAAPQLANTGSSDAGILVGGSALLLLVGATLVVARRRQNAAA